jgi:N-carbamoylputrescine amidase
MSAPFQIGLVQMRVTTDPGQNLENALEGIKKAATAGANVVCLPELFCTQYFCQRQDPALFDLAESIPGPTSDRLAAAARARGVVVIGSIFERRAAGIYHNTAVLFDADGSVAGVYRKMHIPDDPLYFEKYYFTPGDQGFPAFDTRFGKIGMLVCWDQWYPEAARLSALSGAELIVYPTAIGWHPREKAEYGKAQHEAWELMQRSHAVANGVYVAAVNRTGHEGAPDGGLEFWGGSFVCDPSGVVLAKASHDREDVIVCPCDRAKIENTRRHWPFLRDRRIDAYGDLTQRYIRGSKTNLPGESEKAPGGTRGDHAL